MSERQDQTAVQLVRDLHSLAAGRKAILNLTGAVGSGKTSILRRVVEELHREKRWIPVLVTAPNRENDSGPIALLETAGQLRASELLNGEVAILSDPRRCWADKMAAITEVVNKHCEDVVFLCDEPALWYQGEESLLEDTPQFSARLFAEWVESGTRCRRIITGRIPCDAKPAGRIATPSLDDGREMLAHQGGSGYPLGQCIMVTRIPAGTSPLPLRLGNEVMRRAGRDSSRGRGRVRPHVRGIGKSDPGATLRRGGVAGGLP